MKSLLSFLSLAICASAARVPQGTELNSKVEEVQTRGKPITVKITKHYFEKPLTARKRRLKKIRDMKVEARRLANVKVGGPNNGVATNIELQASNFDLDYDYIGPGALGVPFQQGKFVYDTTSGFLAVTGVNCKITNSNKPCSTAFYDRQESEESSDGYDGYTNTTLQYKRQGELNVVGLETLTGHMAEDSFATSVNVTDLREETSTTVKNFGFFQINSMSANVFYPANGILGFAPYNQISYQAKTGPSYVDALYKQNEIKTMDVGFQINYEGNSAPSQVTLGGYDSSAIVGNFSKSHSVVTGYPTELEWTLDFAQVSFSDGSFYQPTITKYAILDTGSPFMYLPETWYNSFAKTMTLGGMDCSGNYCYSLTQTCEETMIKAGYGTDEGYMNENMAPWIKITLGKAATAASDNYVSYKMPYQGWTISTGNNCNVTVQSQPDSEAAITLGDTFMRNYYTLFHFGNSSVSLAPNKAMCWTTSSCPFTTAPEGLGTVLIICIAAGGFLLLLLVIFIIWKFCCKKKSDLAQDYGNADAEGKEQLFAQEKDSSDNVNVQTAEQEEHA